MSSGMKNRRPSNEVITKYEKPLDFNFDDFMNQYLSETPLDDWAQPLVDEFSEEILSRIRAHWPMSSKTRIAFANMTPEIVWEDFDTKTMHLTKRNMATLDPRFQQELQAYVLERMTGYIEREREMIRACLSATYAAQFRRDTALEAISGSDKDHYSFENYGKHLQLRGELVHDLKIKWATIEFARLREIWVLRLVGWEGSNKAISLDKANKGTNNLTNWIAKFRIEGIRIFEESSDLLQQMMAKYEEASGSAFEVNDVAYLTKHLEPQRSRIARVKTNFAFFTADDLYFGDGAGSIVNRILDPCIAGFVEEADAEPLPPPLDMPEFAEEVGFQFEYHY
jgi:hypothetical protein